MTNQQRQENTYKSYLAVGQYFFVIGLVLFLGISGISIPTWVDAAPIEFGQMVSSATMFSGILLMVWALLSKNKDEVS